MANKTRTIQTKNVKDLLFDVEIIDNPVATNAEYSRIVKGSGMEFTTIRPQVVIGTNGKLKTEYVERISNSVDLNYCSNIYELVPNAEIFPPIRQLFFNRGIDFEENYTMVDYVRFYGKIIIKDKKFAYSVNGKDKNDPNADLIYPMVSIQHSYNGKTKYKIHFGYYRLICSNGLVLPVEEMNEFNLEIEGKHTEAIRQSLAALDSKLSYFVTHAEQMQAALTAKFDKLSGNVVADVNDRITEVLAQTGIANVDTKKFSTLEHITKTINDEKHLYNGKINDWLIYNAVNAYIYNPRTAALPEKKQESDSKVLEYMLSHS